MKRNDWVVEMTPGRILDAAQAKLDHHKARFAFWSEAQQNVMAEVSKTGISVEGSLAGPLYSNKTQGFGPRIVVDDRLQSRLNESEIKMEEHRKKISEYEAWVQVLTEHVENGPLGAKLSLNHDDYLFFFGK